MPESNELSEREIEILTLVATGASNKEIAQQLYISTNTVKVHLRNIYAKIEVASRTEAAMYAVNSGLVPAGTPAAGEQFLPDGDEDSTGEPALAEAASRWVDEGLAAAPAASPAVSGGARRIPRGFYWIIAVVLLAAAAMAGFYLRPTDPGGTLEAQAGTDTPDWQEMAAMPTARSGLAAAAYENLVYAIGGETGEGISPAVERYDPLENRWVSLAEKPVAVADASAAVTGGKIYVPGGRTASGEPTGRLEIYDPREDRWTQGASLPVALSAYTLASLEGKLYLFGGWDGVDYRSEVYAYDPEQDAWSQKASMPTPRGYAGAAVAGGRVIVVGGWDGERAVTANEAYTPALDDGVPGAESPWIELAPLPRGRYAMGVANVADTIIVVGGKSDQDSGLRTLGYQVMADNWVEFEQPFTQEWSSLGLVPVGVRLYGMGGQLGEATTGQNLTYQPIYIVVLPLVR